MEQSTDQKDIRKYNNREDYSICSIRLHVLHLRKRPSAVSTGSSAPEHLKRIHLYLSTVDQYMPKTVQEIVFYRYIYTLTLFLHVLQMWLAAVGPILLD